MLSIFAIITLSYSFKVIERIYIYTKTEDTGDQLWYMQLLFFDFMLSELLPIFLWSFFKQPEDCFRIFICNSKATRFSIFQMDEMKEDKKANNLNFKVQRVS